MSIQVMSTWRLPDGEVKISATDTTPETTQKIVRMMIVINPLRVCKKTSDTHLSGSACYKAVATAGMLLVEGDTVYVSTSDSAFDVEPADYCLVSGKGVPIQFFQYASIERGPIKTDIALVPFGTWNAAESALMYNKGTFEERVHFHL